MTADLIASTVLACQEEWRAIPGYEQYEVSSRGRLRSYVPYHGLPIPHMMRTPVGSKGYPHTQIGSRPHGKTFRLSTLVALAFLGPRAEGMEVRHLDGDKLNNDLTNLAYGTHQENMQDAVRHGTHYRAPLKEFCVHGHNLAEHGRYWRKDKPNTRDCGECSRLRCAEHARRRRAERGAA